MASPLLLANLSWPQARELAREGRRVRRVGWLDRWLYRTEGNLWWIEMMDSGESRVVQSADFGRMEFLASDYTTIAPDQTVCVWPPDPDPEDPPPPEIPTEPEPPGEPVKMVITHASERGIGKSGSTKNPLPVAVNVVANGTAAVTFWINGIRASYRIGGHNYDTVDHRFLLAAGASFSWEIRGHSPMAILIGQGGWSGGTITFHFVP